MKGFKDALVAGLEEYYVGIRNGEPVIKRINPKDFKYPAEEGIEFIHDASWCCYRSLCHGVKYMISFMINWMKSN